MTDVKIERLGPVTRITLNRPHAMNAITDLMHGRLQEAFDMFASDDAQQICVITGAGDRAFCAGSDLKEAVASGTPVRPYPANGYAGLIERFDLSKPVIAVVNGLALGGGFEIALACDIVIASADARFGLPEPLVGAVALGGGLHRLARQIGLKQAMGMVLASRRVDAAEALRMGFVTEVVASEALADATDRWCAAILRGAPLAIRASKETMMRGLDEPTLEQAIHAQGHYAAFARWAESEDLREGPRAFAEKRSPVWSGR